MSAVGLAALADIRVARERIAGAVVRTPLLPSEFLSRATGTDVRLKPESLQTIGAFKIRGATNAIRRRLESGPPVRRFVTASSGNHAQAVASAARAARVGALIVMPESASPLKLEATRALGAEIVQHGRFADERKVRALEIAREEGSVYVDPTDDLDVIAGQGTIGLEILDDEPDVETVVVPIGGGGLIAGVAAAVKRVSARARVIGVQPRGSAAMRASLEQGAPVSLAEVSSVADGLLIRSPGELPFAHVKAFVDDIVLVDEDEILDAMTLLAQRARMVVEPSGAVALAAGLAGRLRVPAGTPVAYVVSGGNVAHGLFTRIISEPLRVFGELGTNMSRDIR